jgi:hypothetical protein
MVVYIRNCILICLIIISFEGVSQTSLRLSISNDGNPLDFNFNSFDKYENGISLSTIASVYFVDPSVPTLQWELDVIANGAVMAGDNGGILPLSTIEIVASGTEDPTAEYHTVVLSPLEAVLVEKGSQTDANGHIIFITYNVGTNTPLLGEVPDYYNIDVVFTLQAQ